MQSVKQFLDKDIVKQAKFLHLVTLSLRSRLPALSAEHCWAAAMRDHTLVVVTDSANWVIPIRYQQFELLKQLNSEFQQNLKQIRIKVSSPLYRAKNPIDRPTLSRHNAQQLTSVASTIDDKGLKSALLRLAKRANGPP
jgi:hypothetical protein